MATKQSNIKRSDPEEPTVPPAQQPEESKADDDEFEITIRSLDPIVRPRGVLADG